MSNFKFKKGDLVEITKSFKGNVGHRFTINNYKTGVLDNINNLPCNCYETDISTNGGVTKFTWSAETGIKLVNPDIDEISDSTFSEIMDEITEAITVGK
jgi:hypothetical protein